MNYNNENIWHIPKDATCNYISKIAFVPETFDFFTVSPVPNIIPRILHIIWVGNNPPSYVDKNIDMWKNLMPSWVVRKWTDCDINTNEFPENIVQLLSTVEKGAQKADIMRYFIIEKYGGVYMDTDVTPNKSLEPMVSSFENAKLILCHDIPLTWEYISIGFFAAVPHHPVLQMACSMCSSVSLNTSDIHLKTGPFLFGQAVAYAKNDGEKYYLLPTKYFYRNYEFNERFGTHFYAKMW